MACGDPTDPPGLAPTGSFPRTGPGLEFNRVVIFSDAVYAIALTLLVVALEVPRVANGETDGPALWSALWDERANIAGFFIGFVLLGRYWLAHHVFFASLRSLDHLMISLNLVYLAFVAFMPFPIALISEYEQNPVAFFLFAVSMAIVSLLEVVMYAVAARRGHMLIEQSPRMVRRALLSSGLPVALMLASMPLALVDTTYAFAAWLALIPLRAYMQRRAPAA